MKKTLFHTTFTSIFLIVLFLNTGECKGENIQQRYEFDNIIDIRHTPGSSTCTGWFTDQGAWMGFTLPKANAWINGFCGPFDLDGRRWISNSLVNVSFQSSPHTETFTPDSVSYFPGEAYLASSSPTGKIEQRLFFVDKHTALLICNSENELPLAFTNENITHEASLTIEQNSCLFTLRSGETVAVTFGTDIQPEASGSGYKAHAPASAKTYIAISYFYESKDKTAGLAKAIEIINNPQTYIDQHQARWSGYLQKTLRNDLSKEYNRIAVKSIVTLLSNWRSSKGDLLHDGVIPSHAMDYFIGFWAWDSWKHAVALASFAPELAKDQIRAMFDYQTPEGMVIDCIYTNKRENNDRDSKPPLAAWAVQEVYRATEDVAFVKEIYPKLLKYYHWWYEYRDHDQNGFCEFGSVDGTTEAAAWESGMDNAIRFDRASMVQNKEGAWSFNQESVDLNAYLALEQRILKELAAVAGESYAEADRSKEIAEYFFDQERGFFFDRRLKDASFVHEEGCEAYIPFWAAIASQAQAEQANKLFRNPDKFATYIPFPTVAADNPKFSANGYWRGPIWLDQVYFGIKGLRNYGYNKMADEYTQQVFERLKGLTGSAPIHENYNTESGSRLKSPNFSWSAAHLLLMYKEYKTDPNSITNNKANQFSIYPNPSDGTFTVAEEFSVKSYKLYTPEGRMLKNKIGSNNQINLSGCLPGNYLLEVETQQGSKTQFIIIK